MKHAARILPPMLALMLAAMLAACGTPATDPSGATPGEAQALNEAAAMLDNDSVSANQLIGNTSEQDPE